MSFLLKLWRSLPFSKMLRLHVMRAMNDEFLIGVTAIVLDREDRILVVKHTYRAVPWSVPGGYMKAKEHPSEGVEREILEETGFTVSADELFKVRTDRETGRLDMVYVCSFIGGEFKASSEVTEYKFCHFHELPELFRDQVQLIDEILRRRKAKSK
jgi:8-oxo-dGTP diphosphatase